ncbi:MAG: LemA family protein [Bacteroidetes bacterium]|nr:LemA family protein [Bacteroidota bacterium]
MRKFLVWGGFLFIILLIGFSGCGSYNSMVTMDEAVTANWQQVENQYQRRLDLIPNLVNTVQGYANFEKSTIVAVTEARASVGQVKIDPSHLDEASIKNFQQAQNNLGSAISRLLVVAEQYPDLKANQNFLELQSQLEGTENRIATERMRFNESAQELNTYIRTFPKNLWAGMFGIAKRAYFESDAGAEKAPTVKFDTK